MHISFLRPFPVIALISFSLTAQNLHIERHPARNSVLAHILPNATAQIGRAVLLDSTSSTSSSGTAKLTYVWSVSRPDGSPAEVSNPTSAIASFTPDLSGDYQITLTVSNGAATSTSTSIVSTRNSPPVANAGPSRTVPTGATVILRGNESSDPDGDPLTYRWTLVSAPSGSRSRLIGDNSLSPAFVADKSGNYIAQLIVNDGHADSAPATVTIGTLHTAPRASAGLSRIVSVGDLVQLDGTASTDRDGNSLTYEWVLIAAPDGSSARLSDTTASSPTVTVDAPGVYVAQLIVRDQFLESEPATVVFATNAVLAPTAQAGLNRTVAPGATVTAAGSALDPQGLPLTYHWALLSKPAGSGASLSNVNAQYPSLTADKPGDYIAQLIVSNGMRTSATSTVTFSTLRTPPNAVAGVSQNVLAGASVTLDGSQSSASQTYRWSILTAPSGSSATLALAGTTTPTFTADLPGTYVVQLLTSDGDTEALTPATVAINAADSAKITLSPNPLTLAPEGTGLLTVTVPFVAGPDGQIVNLVSSNGDTVSLPASIAIAPGTRAANVYISSGSIGAATVSATANGLESNTAAVQVAAGAQLRFRQALLLRSKLTVAPSNSAAYPVNLSMPAPAGGVTVDLDISDSSVATLSTSSVFIEAGATTPTVQATVNGLKQGSVVIQGRIRSSVREARNVRSFTNLTVGTSSALAISSTTLPDATLNQLYTFTLAAAGGTPPYTWSNPGAALPPNLSLNPTTGVISGTPIGVPPADGSGLIVSVNTVGLRVSDSSAQTATANLILTVVATGGDTKGPLTFVTSILPSGAVGVQYAQPLIAAGGKPPYTYAILDGSLPNGLSLDPVSGLISGIPTAIGSPRLGFIVTDSATPTAAFATTSFRVTVTSAPPQIATTALPMGYALAPYSYAMIGTGGTPPYTWSASGLPNGLTFNSASGVISGTPSGAGGSSVTITLTDAANLSTMKTLPLTIGVGALSITTASLATGQVRAPYSQVLSAMGGTPPYTWSATGLPNGLSISSAGVISGTPTAGGASSVSLTVKDATSPSQLSATTTLSLTINSQQGLPVTITTTSLAAGTINQSYSATVTASGGSLPYTWSATGLPAGLSINASTGVISGTPTSGGAFSPTITVKDSSQKSATATLSLFINSPALVILTTSLPNGVVNTPYSTTLTASGSGTLTWSASGLPAGLVVNPSTGAITGTPSIAATNVPVTISVTASGSPQQTASVTLSLTINPPMGGGPLTITTPNPLPNAYIGVAYDVFLQAAGGTPPYTWSIVLGRLSPGLALSSTGEISGTPPGPVVFDGQFGVTYQVNDSSGQTATKYLAVNVFVPALAFTSPSVLPPGSVGAAYSQQLQTIFGTAPLTFTLINGSLPPGLNLNGSSGVISGTPAVPSTSTAVIKVTDSSAPTQQDIGSFSITVTSGPVITTTSLPGGTVGTAYSAPVTASGGVLPYSWSATGLPAGLSISSQGVISGTPNAPGTSTVIVTVTDAAHLIGSANLSVTISPGNQLVIATLSLPSGVPSQSYSATLTAMGGKPPYSWGATGLPSGLSINSTSGIISGTPISTGASSVAISVTDSSAPAQKATATLTLSVSSALPLSITTTSLPNGVQNVGYAATVNATGGVMPYTWSASGLPSGLFINPPTGMITGTPAVVGTFQVTVTVTDHLSAIASAKLSLTIGGGAVTITTSALATGVLNATYTQTLTATGGLPPYSWKVIAGRLQPGLVLNSFTGVISGTPSGTAPADGGGTIVSDTYVTIQVTDSGSQTANKQFELLILGQ